MYFRDQAKHQESHTDMSQKMRFFTKINMKIFTSWLCFRSQPGYEEAGLVKSLCPRMNWHDWSKNMHTVYKYISPTFIVKKSKVLFWFVSNTDLNVVPCPYPQVSVVVSAPPMMPAALTQCPQNLS